MHVVNCTYSQKQLNAGLIVTVTVSVVTQVIAFTGFFRKTLKFIFQLHLDKHRIFVFCYFSQNFSYPNLLLPRFLIANFQTIFDTITTIVQRSDATNVPNIIIFTAAAESTQVLRHSDAFRRSLVLHTTSRDATLVSGATRRRRRRSFRRFSLGYAAYQLKYTTRCCRI